MAVIVIDGPPDLSSTTLPTVKDADISVSPLVEGLTTMIIKNGTFDVTELVIRADGEDFQDSREPDLRIGDMVRLNSGGPASLVVDILDGTVTIAWRAEEGMADEVTVPRLCIHRIRDWSQM